MASYSKFLAWSEVSWDSFGVLWCLDSGAARGCFGGLNLGYRRVAGWGRTWGWLSDVLTPRVLGVSLGGTGESGW